MFGLIMHSCSHFKMSLYSLVSCHLEYATDLWEQKPIGVSDKIDADQNKLLCYIDFKLNIVMHRRFGNCNIFNILNLQSLFDCRKYSFIDYLNNNLTNEINDPHLLSLISSKTNYYNVKEKKLFYIHNTTHWYMSLS